MAQQALDAVVSQLRPGTDEVGLFTFDSALQEREFFTRDLAVAARCTVGIRTVWHDVPLRRGGRNRAQRRGPVRHP